jgi:hypothetical protein
VVQVPTLAEISLLDIIMLILPICSALLGTVGTRLRQRQKFAAAKMACYEIVSEIYKCAAARATLALSPHTPCHLTPLW